MAIYGDNIIIPKEFVATAILTAGSKLVCTGSEAGSYQYLTSDRSLIIQQSGGVPLYIPCWY